VIEPLTVAQLSAAVPNLARWRAVEVLAAINATLPETGIASLRGVAAYLAQLGHESGSFRYLVEHASGLAYEPNTRVGVKLGNPQEGDGPRYKGRGYLQLTGRANYRYYGQKLGLDLERNPDLALRPDVAARVLVAYWQDRGLSAAAARRDWHTLNARVTGEADWGLAKMMRNMNRLQGELAVA